MSYDPVYIECRIYAALGNDVYSSKYPRVQVRFDLSEATIDAGAERHAKDVAWHNTAARSHKRESGGSLGAGALGNRMLYGWHATQDAAAQKAFDQLRGLIAAHGGHVDSIQGQHASIRMSDGAAVDQLASVLEQHESLFVVL